MSIPLALGPLGHAALKARHRAVRDGLPAPLNLRLHRALSWLARAEAETDDPDARFVFLWIAFNAAYAHDADDPSEHTERGAFAAFFDRVHAADAGRRVYDAIWLRFPQEIRGFLDNRYVFPPFWAWHNGRGGEDWERRFEARRRRAHAALRDQETAAILSLLFDGLYVLRNQVLHGGATWSSSVNRAQLRDGARILGALTPLFVSLMMERPDMDWGRPHYPVVEG